MARDGGAEPRQHFAQLGAQRRALLLLDLGVQAVDLSDEALRTQPLEQVLHARLLAILALAAAMLQPHDSLGDDEHIFRRDELAHRTRQERLRAQPATRVHRETRLPGTQTREKADVVDWGLRAVVRAARERDLELTWEGEVQRMEEKILIDGKD